MATPQLILKWHKLPLQLKERALIAFTVTEGEKPNCIQRVFSKIMVKIPWIPYSLKGDIRPTF
jgi:hypothetical protein